MSAILEGRRRRNRDSDIVPHTAGAEEATPEQLRAMVFTMFSVGPGRRKELDDMSAAHGPIEHDRSGTYSIRHATMGSYTDFNEEANYRYLEKKYPWLHSTQGGLGFDEDKAVDTHRSFEDFLGSIPHEQWNDFIDDMEMIEDHGVLDEDGATDLEMKERDRWMAEDGGPELIRKMVDTATDTYEGYLLSKTPIDLIWEWCQDTDHYPEGQGQGDVWMDMQEYGADPETLNWFIERLDDDHEGWIAEKRKAFEDNAGEGFDRLLQSMADEDAEVASVYNRLDGEGLFQMFLKAIPDERHEDDDPYWHLWREDYAKPKVWKPGYESETGYAANWTVNYAAALEALKGKEWFWSMVRNWFNRGPEEHPELKLEALTPEEMRRYVWDSGLQTFALTFNIGANLESGIYTFEVDVPQYLLIGLKGEARADRAIEYIKQKNEEVHPADWPFLTDVTEINPPPEAQDVAEALNPADDPALWIKHGGGLLEDITYEDDKIVVIRPRDLHALNWHLRQTGQRQISDQNWRNVYRTNDIFIIQAKQAPDLYGKSERRELTTIFGDKDTGLWAWQDGPDLKTVLANPDYGRNIRRMLLRYYREAVQDDTSAIHILLQLGGGREIRRGERHGHFNRSAIGVALGLHYISKHKYKLAAKAFGRSVSTIMPKGVWLVYNDVTDLLPVFKNRDAAETIFGHEHHDWFDYYYEKENLPDPEDVIKFLDDRAIKHLRSVMCNRRVYFPDTHSGRPGQGLWGEWVVTTQKMLSEYDDATLLDWIVNPTDEDQAEGTWTDIREALQYAGVEILRSATLDEVYTGFVNRGVQAIGGTDHKWGSRKGQKGETLDAFEVFVPWSQIKEQANQYQMNNGEAYDGDLESLAVHENEESVEPDVSNYEASWRDVNKEFAKEQLDRIYELEPPEPVPGSPDYVDPAQMDLPLGEASEEERKADDPALMLKYFSGGSFTHVPVELENRVMAILKDSSRQHNYDFFDLKFEIRPYKGHSEEDIDASDGRLWNEAPHDYLIITYRTDPEQEFLSYEVENDVFRKVRETVINVMRKFSVRDAYRFDPVRLGMAEDAIIYQFTLYPLPPHLLHPPPEDEIPF